MTRWADTRGRPYVSLFVFFTAKCAKEAPRPPSDAGAPAAGRKRVTTRKGIDGWRHGVARRVSLFVFFTAKCAKEAPRPPSDAGAPAAGRKRVTTRKGIDGWRHGVARRVSASGKERKLRHVGKKFPTCRKKNSHVSEAGVPSETVVRGAKHLPSAGEFSAGGAAAFPADGMQENVYKC